MYAPANEMILTCIMNLYQDGKPVDLMTVEQSLRDSNDLDKIGGVGYLANLTSAVSSSENVQYHCQIVKEKSIKRKGIESLSPIIDKFYDTKSDVYDIIDEAQEAVFNFEKTNSTNLYDMVDVMQKVAQRISIIQEKGMPLGINTGLDTDSVLTFQDGKLYFIGARPSMGKTAYVMTCMRNIAKDGIGSGILSLETTSESLGIRLISQSSGLPSTKIVSGQMNPSELKTFLDTCSTLSEHKIWIDDSTGVNDKQLRSKIRAMVKKGAEIIFIDFLTLISAESRSKHEEVGKITKTLKDIAKDYDIPVVCLAQLSRSLESRNNKRPMLSDLRESGSIEEDADGIIFLYRDEYYNTKEDELGNSTKGIAEVIVAKNKDGKTCIKRHLFEAETMTFKKLDSIQKSPF
jgi:replicative DNA helicase